MLSQQYLWWRHVRSTSKWEEMQKQLILWWPRQEFIKYIKISDEQFVRRVGWLGIFFQKIQDCTPNMQIKKLRKGSDGVKELQQVLSTKQVPCYFFWKKEKLIILFRGSAVQYLWPCTLCFQSSEYAKNFKFRIIPADSTKVVDFPTQNILNAKNINERKNRSKIT